MSLEQVTLTVGSSSYTGFKSISMQGAANQAAWKFKIKTADSESAAFDEPAGSPCVISVAGFNLVGFVETFEPNFDSGSHEVTLSGRSKQCDFIDSSIIHATGRFEDKSTLDMANEVDEWGLGVSSDIDLSEVPWFQINQGESPFDAVNRQLKDQDAFLQGLPDGSLVITRGGEGGRQAGALVEGDNILKASAKHSTADRFSDYFVKGQSSVGSGEKPQQAIGKAKDGGIARYRPKLVLNEGETDDDRAKVRAVAGANRSQGRAESAKITIAGWRTGGAVVLPNKLIYVKSQKLRIDGDMLIKSVSFEQGSGGTTANIDLVDPRTLSGKKTNSTADFGTFDTWEVFDTSPVKPNEDLGT